MNCPECGKEMGQGKIKSKRQMFWNDESNKKLISSNKIEWTWCMVDAHRCDECSLIIIKEHKA